MFRTERYHYSTGLRLPRGVESLCNQPRQGFYIRFKKAGSSTLAQSEVTKKIFGIQGPEFSAIAQDMYQLADECIPPQQRAQNFHDSYSE